MISVPVNNYFIWSMTISLYKCISAITYSQWCHSNPGTLLLILWFSKLAQIPSLNNIILYSTSERGRINMTQIILSELFLVVMWESTCNRVWESALYCCLMLYICSCTCFGFSARKTQHNKDNTPALCFQSLFLVSYLALPFPTQISKEMSRACGGCSVYITVSIKTLKWRRPF